MIDARQAAKAVVQYVRLRNMAPDQRSELDTQRLEQAELEVRQLNGVEVIDLLARQALRVLR